MTQIDILTSNNSSNDRNDGFNIFQFATILKRHWQGAIVTFTGVIGIVTVWTFTQTPIYEASGQLLLQKRDQTSEFTGLGDKLGQLDPLSYQSNPLETEGQVLQSAPILDKAISELNLINRKGQLLTDHEMRKLMKVKPVKNTDVLEVSFRNPSSKKAAEVVNKIFQLYLQNDIQVNRAQTRAARQFIATQLPRAERELQNAEIVLRRFKETNHVVDLKGEAKVAVEGAGKLLEELAKAKMEYSEAAIRSEELRQLLKVNGRQAIAEGQLSEAEGLQTTLRQFQQVEDQLAVERKIFEETHPRIIDLREKQAALQESLEGRVSASTNNNQSLEKIENFQKGTFGLDLSAELVKAEVTQLGVAQRVEQIQTFLLTQQQRSNNLPRLEQNQLGLERDLEIARTTYQNLLKSLQDAQLAENQNIGNARVVNPAKVPLIPTSPKIVLNLFIGTVLAMLAGAGMALLLDARDKTVRSVKEVRTLFNYPVLGTIPFLKIPQQNLLNYGQGRSDKYQLVMRDMPQSGGSEAYRTLLANLKFSRSDNPLNAVIVSSSIPGEGKSTTAANLALAMTDLGARVLIMDCDLRKPRQHHIWNIANTVGVTNVLVDSVSLTSAIHIESDRLSIMTSGVLPPNPVALIDSQRMAKLLEELQCIYDYILIDTPPITVATDALLLNKMIDALLMVARPEVLNIPSANASRESIERSGKNVVGVVVNAVIPKNEEDSYYYYYSKSYYGAEKEGKSKESSKNIKLSKLFEKGDRN
jgi:polysaccharide biosynthesis transport protein